MRRRDILRRVARLAGPDVTTLALAELEQVRHGPGRVLRWNAMMATARIRERIRRRHYRELAESEARARRKSELVFVFGSGYSLNRIGNDEWASFAEHDVLGFNAFYNQRWVDVDFHILRGAVYAELRWRPHAEEVARALAGNPRYAQTVFALQDEFLGQHANQLIGYGYLPPGASVLRYRTKRGWGPPTRSLREGLRHATGTLDDAVNLAYCLGWKRIVLVGVDLYDSRYFWLRENETLAYDPKTGLLAPGEYNTVRGQRYDEMHNTLRNGVVRLMGEWRETLARDGVRLEVYNPRSLLAEVLPVYSR